MRVMLNTLLGGGLEFSWLTILLHMIALAILVGGLYLLLYKPVKKMIKKRQDTLRQQVDENAKAREEVSGMKEKYDELLSSVKAEGAKVSEEARKAAEEQTRHIVEGANKTAAGIIERAREEIEREKTRALNEMKGSVAVIATDIAAKIIRREITAEDNKRLIEDCLNKWGQNAGR